ncbi:hypothetical protein WJX81_007109 [Elliptochloris bilobata]|uniref:Uncharacterized protein n=1 Tax=Elliptochloris bilobata TaxID=381761 RepID=A0AAW1QYV5_9CHLO
MDAIREEALLQNYVVVGTSMLAMTRALGDPSFKEGDTPVVEAGRSGSGQERDAATAAAQQLVSTALDKGTRDNVTAIVGLLGWH